ncbi:3,4-dihydroxy-2-butanone 4-phosphate synthase [Rhodococcus sp. KBS0724]|uniref:3,4-dihydroxy-2-butanone-4-phosphate synthase n=1 Tax=Rhodococcus sp. KBS0724 TaxID=1179674 RepID=UPI00110E7274|nr:3,4-dihydroxy-2-butanone-4-phosphate synthase [Rhodococcus sp. KBS0724]TSD50027.1 3,4-dihydroxy-2-butanone 4-phosphate synthase [Rhodococcus sp. KBS0724]
MHRVVRKNAGFNSLPNRHPCKYFQEGEAYILLDGDGPLLVFPAQHATTQQLHFAVRHSSGLVHAAMHSDRLDELRIPDQTVLASERSGIPFTVAVDAVGVTTGISGRDRALTLRTLASPDSVPLDLNRPGHILPVRCRPSALHEARTVWEAAVALVERAGFQPVAVACRLMHDRGDVLGEHDSRAFANWASLETVDWQALHLV